MKKQTNIGDTHMKISLIKSDNDMGSFVIAQNLGMKVVKLKNNEDVDIEIQNLINSDYKNIILSNEVAGFSEDIIKKYKTDRNIKIYIAPSKRNKK